MRSDPGIVRWSSEDVHRWAAVLALTAGYWGAVALAEAVLAWVAFLSFSGGSFGLGLIAAWAMLMLLGVAVAEAPPLRVEVSVVVGSDDAPHLHALVAGLGGAPSVRISGGAGTWSDGRRLDVSLAELAMLDRAALTASIARALGQARGSGLERRMVNRRLRMAALAAETRGTPRWSPPRWYARRFLALSEAPMAELRARGARAAIAAAGPEALARSRARALGPAWLLHWDEHVRRELNAGRRPELVAAFSAAMRDGSLQALVAERACGARAGGSSAAWPASTDLAELLADPAALENAWPLGGDPQLAAEAARAERGLLREIAGEARVAALAEPRAEAARAERGLLREIAGEARVAALAEPRAEAAAPAAPAAAHEQPAPQPPEPAARERPAAQPPEPAAPAPPPPPFEVAIRASRRTRVLAATAAGVLLAALLPLSLVLLLYVPTVPEERGPGIAVGVGAGLLGLLTAGYVVARYSVVFRARGRLRADERRVVIEHSHALDAPVEVPLPRVRVVSVDPHAAEARFPIRAETPWDLADGGRNEPLGFLWRRHEGSDLPIVGTKPDPPNVAVLLDGGERAGLLLHVEDPQAALLGFARLGLARDIRRSDLPQVAE